MLIPLFDTPTPLAPLCAELHERVAAVRDDGRYILGPDVEAFEREFAEYLGVGPCGRRGQRHRCADDRPARSGGGREGRGGGAVVHVLRLRRGDPVDGRDSGVLRCGRRLMQRVGRESQSCAHAAHRAVIAVGLLGNPTQVRETATTGTALGGSVNER